MPTAGGARLRAVAESGCVLVLASDAISGLRRQDVTIKVLPSLAPFHNIPPFNRQSFQLCMFKSYLYVRLESKQLDTGFHSSIGNFRFFTQTGVFLFGTLDAACLIVPGTSNVLPSGARISYMVRMTAVNMINSRVAKFLPLHMACPPPTSLISSRQK